MSTFLYYIPLKELVFAQKGVKPVLLLKEHQENTVPYLDINVLETGHAKEYTYKELGVFASEGDLLIVWDGSRSGLIFRAKTGVVGSTLMSLTPVSIQSSYLYYFLKQQYRLLNTNTTGTSIPHVNSDVFNNLQVPYCSVNEQDKIVKDLENKLNANRSQLSQAKRTLSSQLQLGGFDPGPGEDIKDSLGVFRQAVVNSAITGKQVFPERRKLEVNIPSFVKNSLIEDWLIPNEWSFVRLKDVVKSFDYGTAKRSSENGIVPVLRMGNIQENSIIWKNLKYSSDETDIAKYKLYKGDVLFNRTNSAELVGKTAVFDSDYDAIFAGYLIRLSVSEKINPYFLSYCLNSTFAKSYYSSVMVGSANQANISAAKLEEFLIPLPSIDEQNEIVKRIDELLLISNAVETSYTSLLEDYINLEESILQSVFELDEVFSPENPRDEVLGRIRTEKSKIENQKKSQNKDQSNFRNAMKKKIKTNPSIDIEEVLTLSDSANMSAKEVWKKSKFANDIDGFYEAIKNKVSSSISWEIRNPKDETPESRLFLKSPSNEN